MAKAKSNDKAMKKVKKAIATGDDARKRAVRNRDPITGQIKPTETFELAEDAYNYLLEKTNDGKEIVDIGLRWLRSRNTKHKKAVPMTVKAQIWKTFYEELRRNGNGGVAGDISITNIIINLEDKIKNREEITDAEIIEDKC